MMRETPPGTCRQCATELVVDAIYCHHCGRRIGVAPGVSGADPADPDAPPVVKLHGLYDEKRREELALALIPILAGLSKTIDMSNVEHIDISALFSLIPLLQAQIDALAPPVAVIGMSESVYRALARAGIAGFFVRI